MSQVRIDGKAIPLADLQTLGLVITSGEVVAQKGVVVQIDEASLPDCEVLSQGETMVIALLPRERAEACIDPLSPSAVSSATLNIDETAVEWTSFPIVSAGKGKSQILQAPLDEQAGLAKESATNFAAPNANNTSPATKTEPFSPPDAPHKADPTGKQTEDDKIGNTPKEASVFNESSSSSNKKVIFISLGGAALVLLFIVGGVWFWLHKSSFLSTSPDYTSMPPAEAAKYLKTPTAIGQEGWRRITNGQNDAGLRLLSYAAAKHDPSALQKMGELNDPAKFRSGGPIPQANPQEAARYYKEALRAGNQAVSTEREKLLETLRKQADNGDQNAAFTLKEYAQ